MRYNQIIIFSAVFLSFNVYAGEAQWFVSVYGENMQQITGASVTADVQDGKFLEESFSGKKIYVRCEEHYELDQFRPSSASTTGGTASAAVVASDEAATSNTTGTEIDMSSFGPLVDSGVMKFSNDDFKGWYCSHLYVTPLGGRDYELSCDKKMVFE